MKKHILLLTATIAISVSLTFAQTKIDKYCQVTASPNLRDRFAKISFGEQKDFFALKDTSEFEDLNVVNSLKTEVDVLNYMGKLGWALVNMHAVLPYWDVLYFKKTYDSSALVQ